MVRIYLLTEELPFNADHLTSRCFPKVLVWFQDVYGIRRLSVRIRKYFIHRRKAFGKKGWGCMFAILFVYSGAWTTSYTRRQKLSTAKTFPEKKTMKLSKYDFILAYIYEIRESCDN